MKPCITDKSVENATSYFYQMNICFAVYNKFVYEDKKQKIDITLIEPMCKTFWKSKVIT